MTMTVLCKHAGHIDLVLGSLYRASPCGEPGFLLVTDESLGEYLYPAGWFEPVEFTP